MIDLRAPVDGLQPRALLAHMQVSHCRPLKVNL